MDKWTQKKKIVKEIFWFLLKFNLFLIPFYAVIYFDVNFYPLQKLFASFIGVLLEILGKSPEVSDIFIHVGNLPIDISRDCLGWKSAYSLFALIAASGGEWKKKLEFLGLWLPLSLIFNVLRVLITILIGLKFGVKYLELFHEIIFQEVTVLLVIGVWYVWFRKTTKFNKEKQQ